MDRFRGVQKTPEVPLGLIEKLGLNYAKDWKLAFAFFSSVNTTCKFKKDVQVVLLA